MKPLGPIAYIIKARVTLLRDLGSPLSPFNAFLTLQGIETLPLRMERHSANAAAVAAWLGKRPEVTKVIHPSKQLGYARQRAEKYLKGGQGGLVGFELKGGKEAGRKFIDALKLLYHVANIGDARSLAIHPATTTHSQLGPEEQLATACRRTTCASRSASSTSTTSSPTSTRRSRRRHKARGGDRVASIARLNLVRGPAPTLAAEDTGRATRA